MHPPLTDSFHLAKRLAPKVTSNGRDTRVCLCGTASFRGQPNQRIQQRTDVPQRLGSPRRSPRRDVLDDLVWRKAFIHRRTWMVQRHAGNASQRRACDQCNPASGSTGEPEFRRRFGKPTFWWSQRYQGRRSSDVYLGNDRPKAVSIDGQSQRPIGTCFRCSNHRVNANKPAQTRGSRTARRPRNLNRGLFPTDDLARLR